jgi:hypothetical protein
MSYMIVIYCDVHRDFRMNIHWRSRYVEGRAGIPLTGLTIPLFCACPKSGPGFPTSYVVVFFVFSEFN